MDKTCNADTWGGNAFSFTTVYSENVTKTNILKASVLCYVSNDFDGTSAIITSDGAVEGEKVNEYDLKLKGTWQKLCLKQNCLDGNATVYLYFSKFGVTDFSSLKGYVIYAYPQVEVFEKSDSVLSSNSKLVSFDNLNIDMLNIYSYFNTSFFHFNKTLLSKLLSPYGDKDLIRKWALRFISEDTTYFGFSKKIAVNTISTNFIGGRTTRWQFAMQIFNKEFSWKQKIFGGGFNFLNWYGYYFLKDKTKSDWPHNPFLSILLYSGIVGLVLYIVLLYKVLYYYLKYIKEYPLFFIFFLITFFITFFSGSSPFDPPVMGFFILLPFFIHSIHKNVDNSV